MMSTSASVYLIDTNVVSEARKQTQGDRGVRAFFEQAAEDRERLYISVVTVGELRQGVERIRHRGDRPQAARLEQWLEQLIGSYGDNVLDINTDIAQLWGRLRVPHPENALDKLIAATALIYDLTVVTRNQRDFAGTGARLLNPFSE